LPQPTANIHPEGMVRSGFRPQHPLNSMVSS
jgi:hypothetical protein